jgi:hypothetical protein
MTASTLATPVPTTNASKLRYALVALVFVGTLVASFVLGRWTSSSDSSSPATRHVPRTSEGVVSPAGIDHVTGYEKRLDSYRHGPTSPDALDHGSPTSSGSSRVPARAY